MSNMAARGAATSTESCWSNDRLHIPESFASVFFSYPGRLHPVRADGGETDDSAAALRLKPAD